MFTFDGAEGAVPIELMSAASCPTWLEAQSPALRAWSNLHAFQGEAGQVLPVSGRDGEISRVIAGIGADDLLSLAALPPLLPDGVYALSTDIDERTASLVMMAWCQGTYQFSRYKTDPQPVRVWPRLALPARYRRLVEGVVRQAEGVFLTRDLVNTPAGDMGPGELEAAARALAEGFGAHIRVTTGEDLLEQGLGLIHAVGRASARPPRLIDIGWGDEAAPRVTLVGKGVCFDTGGLNLKSGEFMALMKKDMGGAAHVLGLARMIMAGELPVRLRVLVPAVENAVSGNAFRPGDVLRSYKGLTVEIGNTDAEGRLILADALSLADEESPDLLIDMATLTGAARTAVGPGLAPYYTDDEQLAREVEEAAAVNSDPVWRMPLWRPYEAWLESTIADINHIADKPMAGSITAALFLNRFVERARSWTHFDIFGWQLSAQAGRPKGAAPQAIRALYDLLEGRYGTGGTVDTHERRRPHSAGGDPA